MCDDDGREDCPEDAEMQHHHLLPALIHSVFLDDKRLNSLFDHPRTPAFQSWANGVLYSFIFTDLFIVVSRIQTEAEWDDNYQEDGTGAVDLVENRAW